MAWHETHAPLGDRCGNCAIRESWGGARIKCRGYCAETDAEKRERNNLARKARLAAIVAKHLGRAEA